MSMGVNVRADRTSMVPRADVPRSKFRMEHNHKTTFDAGYLVPIFVEEVLPGDYFKVRGTMLARLSTPIVPVMENLYLETFFFFVPNRLLWTNWKKFMGEQNNPGDSTSYTVPQVVSPASGWTVGSLADYFGIPTVGQIAAAATHSVNVLPMRAYNLIWNEWFRDQNLQTWQGYVSPTGDGPDLNTYYVVKKRGKRHDYFTSCLPWTQKGTPLSFLTGQAYVKTNATDLVTGAGSALKFLNTAGGAASTNTAVSTGASGGQFGNYGTTVAAQSNQLYPSNLYADLSTATGTTINLLRQAMQIQRLLERDARGGTRYIELVRSHFGVVSPDARLQRPEYLGGGVTPFNVSPVAQTSATGVTGGSTAIGTLSAFGTATGFGHGFNQGFTEHGYIIGLVNVRADLTYQQGLRKLWSRSTRYDFYFPVFAFLGEQAVLNKEIYLRGDANDDLVFGYQERWAEYRYNPSIISGLFRSTASGTLDVWHLAQKFTSLPALNDSFIQDTPPLSRILATASTGKEILLDAFFDITAVRPLPMYSVPGLMDHF